jgi:inosine/xanthosine triphosphate pyrophosphatase family protein
VKFIKTALSQFAFHSDDTSLFIAGLKSQAGNYSQFFENLISV